MTRGAWTLRTVGLALIIAGGWRFGGEVAVWNACRRLAASGDLVPATVLDAGIRVDETWRSLGRRVEQPRAFVFYTYAFGSREYEGTSLSPAYDPTVTAAAYHRNWVDGLSPGMATEVWLDPSNPAASWLSLAPDLIWSLANACVCVGLVLAGACCARGGGSITVWWWTGLALATGTTLAGLRLWQWGDGPVRLVLGAGFAVALLALRRRRATSTLEPPLGAVDNRLEPRIADG